MLITSGVGGCGLHDSAHGVIGEDVADTADLIVTSTPLHTWIHTKERCASKMNKISPTGQQGIATYLTKGS